MKQSEELAKEEAKPFEHKDYSLKQGQKIHVSLGVSPSSQSCRVTVLSPMCACMISSLDSDDSYMQIVNILVAAFLFFSFIEKGRLE